MKKRVFLSLLLSALLLLCVVFVACTDSGETETDTSAESASVTEAITDAPTDAPTEPAEIPTETPTEPATELVTDTATESASDPATETPTEKPTEAPTETPTEAPFEWDPITAVGGMSPDTYFENGEQLNDGGSHEWLVNNRPDGISGVTSAGFRGWCGLGDKTIEAYGYAFDDNQEAALWSADFIVEAEDGLAAAAGQPNVTRYLITIDLAAIPETETHTLHLLVKATDGSIYELSVWNSAPIKVTGNQPVEKNLSFDDFQVGSVEYHNTAATGNCFVQLEAVDYIVNIPAGGNHDAMLFRGWIGFEQAMAKIGYAIDGGETIWSDDFFKPTEDAVKGAGGEFAQRFEVTASTADLEAGTHTVACIIELEDGRTYTYCVITLEIAEPIPDPEDYAEGMKAWYEGMGDGNTWKDLVGNNDMTVTIDENNYFTENGLYVDSTQHYFPQEIVDLVNGKTFTVEILLSDVVSKGTAFNTFLNSKNDNISLYRQVANDKLFLKWAQTGQPRPTSEAGIEELLKNDALLTITYNADGKVSLYINGELIAASDCGGKAMGADNLFIGHEHEQKVFSALYKSIRFYDRELTAAEVMNNKRYDEIRANQPEVKQIPEELWGTWSGNGAWFHYDLIITADGADLVEEYDAEYPTHYEFVSYEDGVLTLLSMAEGMATLTITDENTAHFYMNRFNEFDMVRGGEAGGDDEGGIPADFYGTWEGDYDANGMSGHAVWTITSDSVSLSADMDYTYRIVSYEGGVLTLNCDGFPATMELTADGIHFVDGWFGAMDLTLTA